MATLSTRQVAVLRALPDIREGSYSAWLLSVLVEATTAQVQRDLAYLDRKGLAQRRPEQPGDHEFMWGRTTSGFAWLGLLDAGRPWMIRGHKR